ncbi:MAG: hypothetical protein CFH41_01917 [Alphaproteobacteria bacterium MarineAlpha11_Bin1]|nr:MAG: hypothetical protein CFH41_01917 [Alphaproteobacteria bacterium MarineAlpha11_Bin1]
MTPTGIAVSEFGVRGIFLRAKAMVMGSDGLLRTILVTDSLRGQQYVCGSTTFTPLFSIGDGALRLRYP